MKTMYQLISLVIVSWLFTGSVFAHVTVNPGEAVVGRAVFSVRVPNEKDVATTTVRLVIPEGITVGSIAPVPGWTHSEKREEGMASKPEVEVMTEGDSHAEESGGRITEITWTGGRIGVGEFLEFPVSVLYEGEPGKVSWKAYQTYADGEVIAWDGTSDDHPAPSVDFRSEARIDAVEKAVANGKQNSAAGAGQILPVAAILLSVAAIAFSLKKNNA